MSIDYSSANPFMGGIVEEDNQTFKADPIIVKSVTAARSIFTKLRANNLKRINLYKEIDGLIAGEPPYNPSEMMQAGLQHVANFNDMTARAVIERACLAYWNLLHNSEYLVNFTLRYKDAPEATYYSQIMSEHWDYAVKNLWPSFLVNVASLQFQLVKFGISPILFPDERDPRWRVIEVNRFFVPDQAQCDLDMLTTVDVESEFTVQYLWGIYNEFKDQWKNEYIENPDLAPIPWNLYEIGKLLLWTANTPIKDTILPHDIYELNRKLYSGDISFDRMFNDTVKIESLLQQEYNGKITHYMFHRHFDDGNFLFKQKDQFRSMSEAMILFTMNPGEYTIHANRGFGHKLFSLLQAKTMLDCSVVDMAKWSSTPIIKSSSLNSKDVEQIRFYPGVPTNIGTAEFVTNSLGANIESVIAVGQYLSNLIQFNVTYSGSDSASPDPDKGSLSPTQTRLMAFKEFSVLKNNIMHFYSIFDRLVKNMTIKMLRSKKGYPGHDIAKEWKDRCLDDGVPEEVFDYEDDDKKFQMPKHIDVQATRVAGAGSQVAHLMGLQELQAIAGSFDKAQEKEYTRQFIMATVGPEYVETFVPKDDEQEGQDSIAALENAIMQAGKSPVFSNKNDSRTHFTTHMALATEVIQGIQQQQMEVIQADSVFNVLVPHLQEHLVALEKNMFARDFAVSAKKMFGQVAQYAALNRKNAARAVQKKLQDQQQQAQQQQQVMSEEELKNLQVINDEKRKDIKLQAQTQRQEKAGAAKEAALNRKVDGELAIKSKKAGVENTLATQSAALDNLLKNRSEQQAQENPSQYLENINGATPAPYDLELETNKGPI